MTCELHNFLTGRHKFYLLFVQKSSFFFFLSFSSEFRQIVLSGRTCDLGHM